MYVGGTGSTLLPTSDSTSKATGSGASAAWHRNSGNISKRFDIKDEYASPTPKPAPVRRKASSPLRQSYIFQVTVKSAVTKDDEAAAMAAMFQAQTANWEETQEKMSQLVSPACGFPVYVVERLLMNVVLFPVRFVPTVSAKTARFEFTTILGVHPAVVESLIMPLIIIISRNVLCLLVTSAIAVDRKVC